VEASETRGTTALVYLQLHSSLYTGTVHVLSSVAGVHPTGLTADQGCRQVSTFFSIFTTFHIRGGSPLDIWCLLGLSGEGLPPTSPPGREPASTASRPRFIATRACSCSRSPSRSNIFFISTSIWWDPYSTVAVAISFSLSWIAHPNGWKQFRCLIRLRRHALKLKFSLGFFDLECPK
jgi:hypothetical protein